jgi:magnesium transporter
MIMDCAVYRDGCRRGPRCSIADAATAAKNPDTSDFVWVGLVDPTREELDEVQKEFGIHELSILDATSPIERPKVEHSGGVVTVVMRSARYDDEAEAVEFGQLTAMMGERFIVVVRLGMAAQLISTRAQLERDHTALKVGPKGVLLAITKEVARTYRPVLDGLENDIDEVENEVFNRGPHQPTERIYYLYREVLSVQRATQPLLDTITSLMVSSTDIMSGDSAPLLVDVRDSLRDTADRVQTARELLKGALEANLTQVSLRQNEDMRKMSAWVAILAVPTMVAGIYGMNFDNMPELHSTVGYPIVLAAMAIVCFLLYLRFRKSGWL